MQMLGFLPPWLWVWLNLHAHKTLSKRIFDLFAKKNFRPWLIIILSSIFDSSVKPAVNAINKPTAIHLQK